MSGTKTYLDIDEKNMDRKTRRKIRRELKKMDFNQILNLVNDISAREKAQNDIRQINKVSFKEGENND